MGGMDLDGRDVSRGVRDISGWADSTDRRRWLAQSDHCPTIDSIYFKIVPLHLR